MKWTKKLAIIGCAAMGLALAACSSAKNPPSLGGEVDHGFTVTDVADRKVTFNKAPERVILGEGRAMFAVAFLNREDPGSKVVALGSDLHQAAPSFEQKLFEAKPELKSLPTIGKIASGDVTVENLIAHEPDVIVMTLDHKKAAEESGFLDKLDQAGLQYVFTDFRQKPLENTTRSVDLLGEILDRKAEAQKFNDFYRQRVEDIENRAAAIALKPRTLLWRAAGLKDCCATVSNSNLGDLVNAAGGKNLGDELLDTESGDLSAEKIIAENPDAIIATGGSWAKDPKKPDVLPHVELGYTATVDVAERTLAGLLKTPGFDTLAAPKNGELHAVFHQFYDSPYNVFALEQFAKWLHPEEFKDLDPVKDFELFHEEYLPFSYSGTFFASWQPESR